MTLTPKLLYNLSLAFLLTAGILFACGKGGGGGGGWENKARSDLRAERSRSTSGEYASKWGLPKK